MADYDSAQRFTSFLEAMPPSTLEKLPKFTVDQGLGDYAIDVPIDNIISREIHELEKEKIWSRAWQMVCREEQIPNVGDQHVYDICDKSYIIVRAGETEIKAYVN